VDDASELMLPNGSAFTAYCIDESSLVVDSIDDIRLCVYLLTIAVPVANTGPDLVDFNAGPSECCCCG